MDNLANIKGLLKEKNLEWREPDTFLEYNGEFSYGWANQDRRLILICNSPKNFSFFAAVSSLNGLAKEVAFDDSLTADDLMAKTWEWLEKGVNS